MNINKLRGKIVEMEKNYAMCADVCGMGVATFTKKMNRKGSFTIDQLEKLGDFLEMTREERGEIFLG